MLVGGDELAHLARIADDDLGAAVADAVVEVGLGDAVRERHEDGAEPLAGPVQLDRLGLVREHARDAVAGLDAAAARPAAIRAARSRNSAYVSRRRLGDERLRVGASARPRRGGSARGSRARDLRDRVDDRRVARCSGRAGRRACRRSPRASARRSRESRSSAAMRIPGVQKPHCSAWWRWNASWSGVSAPAPASPSTVTISAPSTCAARRRHERTATPSSLHGARTADAVLAADVRPGEAESVPEEVGQEEARLDLLAVAPAVDGDVDGDHAARSRARATTRSTRTRTRCRR